MQSGSSLAVIRIILILSLMLALASLEAAIRKEFAAVEQLVQGGKLDEATDALVSLKPNNEDERAFVGYYNARIKIKQSEIISGYQFVTTKYPQSEYAQLARLELAKLQILERNWEAAAENLRKITSNKLMERYYWQAFIYWWNDDYAKAISSVENYLRLAPKSEYSEDAYYLMAECYLTQKKAYSAITSLVKLQELGLSDVDQQYLMYRLGYAHEQSGKNVEAVDYYRQGYELDKYSQIAYAIEDRLFELRYTSKSIDINFLYPYSLLQIPIEEAAPLESPVAQGSSPNANPVSSPPPDLEAPLKLKAKPGSGIFLQAGRFSQEANANKMVLNIRLLSLPAAYFEDSSGGKKSWVVVSGPYSDRNKADAARNLLLAQDINCFVAQY